MILLLLIASLGFGLLASGGVLTVLVSVGLVPRFIQRAHSGKHITLLENFIIAGTVFGELWSVFPVSLSLPGWLGTMLLFFFLHIIYIHIQSHFYYFYLHKNYLD